MSSFALSFGRGEPAHQTFVAWATRSLCLPLQSTTAKVQGFSRSAAHLSHDPQKCLV